MTAPTPGTPRSHRKPRVALVFGGRSSEHAISCVTAGSGLSQVFLGLIIIPIIGNAAEHAAAVIVARKG